MATSDNHKPDHKPASDKSPAPNADKPERKQDKEEQTAIFPGEVSPEAT